MYLIGLFSALIQLMYAYTKSQDFSLVVPLLSFSHKNVATCSSLAKS